jgi:uncharacterized protein (TIGR00730 family)
VENNETLALGASSDERFLLWADDERGVIEPLEPASRRPTGPVARRIYTAGDPNLDKKVQELLELLSEPDLDLVQEMLTSVLRLKLQKATRAEMKMVNAALKEFAYTFRVFAPYRDRQIVSIFGSARTKEGEPAYVAARDLAREMARLGWMVITGAGFGIMQAGHEGAGAEQSFGANIRLPGLNPANVYIANDNKLINYKYFFTRKVTFMKESRAFVLLPGGMGTMDEAFELLTLIQTGKSDLHPVVMLEPEGSTYWKDWLHFIKGQLLARGLISPADLSLFKIAESVPEAVEEILTFYANYQSARFVGDRLIIRLKHAPSDDEIARLNEEFADLLDHGSFKVIDPTPPEIREGDSLDLDRLAFYPVHNYGRIRQLIDALNRLPARPA